VVDLSDPHLVPTGLKAAPDGGIYVGYLTAAPFPDGGSKVTKITADGHVTDVWTGLTTLTDVAVAPDGTLYALEMSTQNGKEPPFYRPNTGRLVRQTGPSTLEPVLTGLPQPVRMAVGPDGWLYVAMPAHDAEQKPGVILRVDPSATNLSVPEGLLDTDHCAPVLPPATPAASAASTTTVPETGALPAPTVTAVTTSEGTSGGPMTIEITIRIAVDPSSGAMTVPVTVNATAVPSSGGVSPEAPSLPPAAASTSTPAAAASGQAVTVQNMAFNPATLTIPKGTTVTWTNSDPVAHTVTASGGAFNSGHLNPGQTFSHTFDQAGTFDYQCTYHPYMKGTIVVQ
jgi:plastocyanin